MKTTFKGLLLGIAATTMTLGLTAEPGHAADLKNWQREIAKAVASKQVYPRSALRREEEGEAKVKVTVARDGKIANFEILQETGHASLDREVPKLIERLDPLPKPPSDVGDDKLTFILPLAWVLQ